MRDQKGAGSRSGPVTGSKVHGTRLIQVKRMQPRCVCRMHLDRVAVRHDTYFNGKAIIRTCKDARFESTAPFRAKVLQGSEMPSRPVATALAKSHTIEDAEGVLQVIAEPELPGTPHPCKPEDGDADAKQDSCTNHNSRKSSHGKHVR